jgi:cysteine-rich repeat protein
MTRLALLGATTLALTACQMPNPAFDERTAGGTTTLDTGDGDSGTTLDTGDGDGDSGTTLDTGDGDGDGDPSLCGNGQLDPGEACDGNTVPNGQCSADCHIQCQLPFADCNQLPEDGCEANFDNDALNCGSCGTNCMGSSCELGLCGPFPIADGSLPYDVAIDGEKTVYWTDREAGTVSRKVIGGGAVELVAGQLNQPAKIALGQDRVFFTEWGAGQISGWNFELNDAWILQGQTGAWAVTAGGGEVFWGLRDQGIAHRYSQDNQGPLTTLVEGVPPLIDLAYAGDYVAWISGIELGIVGAAWLGDLEPEVLAIGVGANLNEVASNGSYIFYTNASNGTVEKLAIEGGPPEILAAGQAGPYGIVSEGDWVFWGNAEGGQVMAIQLGSDQPVLLAEGQTQVRGMDANGQYLVWARNQAGGGIWGMVLP